MKLTLLAALVTAAWASQDPFRLIHVDELSKALESKNPPVVCDANAKNVREDVGFIPGAKLLSSSKKFDPAKELPADKKTPLVFYCFNEQCMASHQAAKKAVKAGYADVAVLSDGIQGWVKAGKPFETLPKKK